MKFFRSKFFIALIIALALWIMANVVLYEPDIPFKELKSKYTTSASQFLEIDGMQVHYRIEGTGEPLVLIHGTGAALQSWDEWTNILSAHYKVIRMDIPAFGLTGPRADGDYSEKMYVKFIEQFAGKIGIDSFYLAGNSLGGLIAWHYAAAYPLKVKKLILLDPGGFYEVKKKGGSFIFNLARNYPALTDFVSKIGTSFFVAHTLRDVFYDDSKITEVKKKMYTELNEREGNRHAFVERARIIHTYDDKELRPIAAPTLIMWGNEDVLIDVEEAEHFKKITNSTFIFYEHVGHSPQEEIPEHSAADAMRFLNGHLSESPPPK